MRGEVLMYCLNFSQSLVPDLPAVGCCLEMGDVFCGLNGAAGTMGCSQKQIKSPGSPQSVG